MLRVNAINRQELLKCLTFNPKSLVFKTVSVPATTFGLVGGFFVGLSVILWLKMNKDNKKMKEI